jgi:hypothetical protein
VALSSSSRRKSLPAGSEAHQLRVGLGQLFEYRAVLGEAGTDASLVLAVPRVPKRAEIWQAACADASVALIAMSEPDERLRSVLLT